MLMALDPRMCHLMADPVRRLLKQYETMTETCQSHHEAAVSPVMLGCLQLRWTSEPL